MNPLQILLAEDDMTAAWLTRDALENSHLPNELHVVADGEDALLFLRKHGKFAGAVTPDLVILDLNMPKRDGLEVLQEMRADERFKKMPVIILTSSSAERDVEGTFRANASCYITKPFEPEQFLKAIEVLNKTWLASSREK